MSADAVRLVADVLRQHGYGGADLRYLPSTSVMTRVEHCQCGWNEPGEGIHEAHQAAAVVAALGGLTPEWAVTMGNVGWIGTASINKARIEHELAVVQSNNARWERDHDAAPDWASNPGMTRRWVSGWTPEETHQ